MTYVETARPAGEQSAWASDAPCFVARNELRYQFAGTSPLWSNAVSPTFSDVDRTSATDPVTNAYDGLGDIGTHGVQAGSFATWHYLAQLNSATVDTVIVEFAAAPQTIDQVLIELGNNASFSTTATLGYWAGPSVRTGGSRLRLVALADDVYTTARYFKVSFTYNAGQSTSPSISEIYVGRRRQLSRQWNYGGDDEPFGGIDDTFEGNARGIVSYNRAYGFSDFEFEFTPSGGINDMFGLNDVSTWRQIYRDCRGGGDPVIYIPFPWSRINTTWSSFGESGRTGTEAFLEKMDSGTRLPMYGPFLREGSWAGKEIPPYYRVET